MDSASHQLRLLTSCSLDQEGVLPSTLSALPNLRLLCLTLGQTTIINYGHLIKLNDLLVANRLEGVRATSQCSKQAIIHQSHWWP